MWKIKNSLINNWILKHLTHSEIVTLLYFALHQSDAGWARGMYYDLVAKSTGISKSSYYNACYGLEQKGIIRIEKQDNRDRDILILDNDFRSKEFKSGYIDLCHKIFKNPYFWKMKANEILLTIDLLKICSAGKHAYIIGIQVFVKKYKQLFGVEERTIKQYLHTIKQFFSVRLNNRMYSIAAKIKKVYTAKISTVGTGESESYRMHRVYIACARAKIYQCKEKDVQDTAALINQYRNYKSEEELIVKLSDAIKSSVSILNKNIKRKTNWKYELNCKLVHSLFRQSLHLS